MEDYPDEAAGGRTQLLPRIDWNIRFFGAHKQTVPAGWSMAKESHHAFEILIVLDGTQHTWIENEAFILAKEDILLIPPGFEHTNSCNSSAAMTYFCAHFDIDEPALRMQILKNCDWVYAPANPYHDKLKECLLSWIGILEDEAVSFTQAKLRAQVVLFELLGVLVEIQPLPAGTGTHQSMTTAKYAKEIAEAIKRAFKTSMIPENEGYTVHIQPIIASLGISPNYGLEVFQKIYHMSPRKYLSGLKLQEAKILLQQPKLSLDEIAGRLGYNNLSHFSRQFKRWTGMNPSEFRKAD
ncbi:AraC family transcriptional regulator [Paenibacillus sp. MMS20-IR301]|uniref:AraC family transcriptional regulator n=1 Tax=Paenibacillus sp. MMS20-IR301 TaxID=2895946 RepID=UPI0028E53263|nr:AraC family transcriptional regulator [Paenibacillus sp. MMS20-IR301]WNS43129.1 AraC family transcriptional regulator [Paenibacillus sp. MMS20-IR301]